MTEEQTLYEAIYILSTELSDQEVEQQAEQLEEVVRQAGGEVEATRDFRTRRLAYEIDGHTHGVYKLLYFRGTAEVVEALGADFAVRQEVVRGRVFVPNPEAIVSEPAEQPEEAAAPEPEEPAEPPTEDESAAEEESA